MNDGLSEETEAEIRQMKESQERSQDFLLKLFGGLLSVGVVAVVAFIVNIYSLPDDIERMSSRLESTNEKIDNFATKQELKTAKREAVESARTYTDARVSTLGAQLSEVQANSKNTGQDVRELTSDLKAISKEQRQFQSELQKDITDIKIAVERTKQ